MRILTVVGARPQFIKAAVVSRALAGRAEEFIVHTGQHYDANMSDVFFEEMQIPHPRWNLGIHGASNAVATARMLEAISARVEEVQPDYLLVYGDTNSTLAGALAGAQHRIPVAHVEAGMRNGNLQMPEEINRVVTDRISTLLLCPTPNALQNLYAEGFREHSSMRLAVVGDVMFDAAMFYLREARPPEVNLPKEFNLCTIHRAEILRSPQALCEAFDALDTISRTQLPVVLPLHPHTAKVLAEMGYDLTKSSCVIIEPTSYFETLWLLSHAHVVLTDSGGLQREAYFLNKPCVTLRNETEWVELVSSGVNVLSGTERDAILRSYDAMAQLHFDNKDSLLFGDGHAGEKIVDLLLQNK